MRFVTTRPERLHRTRNARSACRPVLVFFAFWPRRRTVARIEGGGAPFDLSHILSAVLLPLSARATTSASAAQCSSFSSSYRLSMTSSKRVCATSSATCQKRSIEPSESQVWAVIGPRARLGSGRFSGSAGTSSPAGLEAASPRIRASMRAAWWRESEPIGARSTWSESTAHTLSDGSRRITGSSTSQNGWAWSRIPRTTWARSCGCDPSAAMASSSQTSWSSRCVHLRATSAAIAPSARARRIAPRPVRGAVGRQAGGRPRDAEQALERGQPVSDGLAEGRRRRRRLRRAGCTPSRTRTRRRTRRGAPTPRAPRRAPAASHRSIGRAKWC